MAFDRGQLLGVLALSVILRILILAFDGLLWYDNPLNGHAYALVLFTVVDLALLGLVVSGRGYRAVFIWATLQTLALALNPLTGFTINITPAEFASYLFGLTPIESTSDFSCPFLCPPFRYSYAALLIIQIAMAGLAVRILRTVSR